MSIEFKKPSIAEIEGFIQKELKDKPYDSLRIQRDEIVVDPIYTEASNPVHIPKFLEYNLHFQFFAIENSKIEETNQHILSALNSGISGLILDFQNSKMEEFEFDILFKDVHLPYLHLDFRALNEYDSLVSWIQKCFPDIPKHQMAIPSIKAYSQAIHIENQDFIAAAAKFLSSISKNSGSQFIYIELSGDYFWDLSKIRAFKILLGNLVKLEDCQGQFIVVGESSTHNKSTEKPENNILQLTTEAMSGIIGGCEGIWIKPFDFESNKLNLFSNRMSQNIYNIILEESHLDFVQDAAYGSYFIENYTQKIAEAIYQKMN